MLCDGHETHPFYVCKSYKPGVWMYGWMYACFVVHIHIILHQKWLRLRDDTGQASPKWLAIPSHVGEFCKCFRLDISGFVHPFFGWPN